MNSEWWREDYEFFGTFYLEGDHSRNGYLAARTLTIKQRTAEEIDGVCRLLRLNGNDRVLDIPCGYGRHSIGLAARGLNIVGADINHFFLQFAEEQATLSGVSVDFRHADMRQLDYVEEFDAVINMCYSFGFFDSDQENFAVLRRFFRALKDDGRFLMHTDVNLPRVRAGTYKQDERRDLESGGTLRVIDRYDPVSKRMKGAWIITGRDGIENRKDYSVRVYEKDEFIEMCREVGFHECVAYSSWAGASWSEEAEEIMFVATK